MASEGKVRLQKVTLCLLVLMAPKRTIHVGLVFLWPCGQDPWLIPQKEVDESLLVLFDGFKQGAQRRSVLLGT